MGAEDLNSGPRVSMQAVYPWSHLPSSLCHSFSLSSCDGTPGEKQCRKTARRRSKWHIELQTALHKMWPILSGRSVFVVPGPCGQSEDPVVFPLSRKAICELGSFSFVTAFSVLFLFLEPCLNVFQVVWPFTS